MLQDHIWKVYCSRSLQQTCSWSSVHFKYGPGAYLTWKFFRIVDGPGPYIWLETSFRLLMVEDHKPRPKPSQQQQQKKKRIGPVGH